MITWLIQQCRLLYKFFVSNDSARQMAVAAAFGVLLGLVPKGNLLAVGLSCVFLSFRVHLATGAVVGLAATFLAGSLDTLFHRLGETILTQPSFQALFAKLYELPFGPWTAFNNTIVCGSLVVGLVAFYPTYRLSLPLFERWHEWKKRNKSDEASETDDTVDSDESVHYEQAVSRAVANDQADAETFDGPITHQSAGTDLSEELERTLANVALSKNILTKTKRAVVEPAAKTEAPAAESPATESSATESSATESPPAQSPVTESPVMETPAMETPATADSIAADMSATDAAETATDSTPIPPLALAKPPQELRIDNPHTVPVRVSDSTPASNVPQRRPSRPHYLPPEEPQVVAAELSSVRETLQRRRFKQFVAEVESISRRVA